MRLRNLALLTVVCLITTRASAGDVADGPLSDHSTLNPNAALQYWQAFAQMPTLDKDQEKIIGEWRTVSLDDPAVKKLVDDSRVSMKFLHRATQLKECDWGLDYHEGISLLLPQLVRARDLARLAALSARYDFEHGNKESLPKNATSMMVLARRVGQDPFMICLLVQYSIEEMTIDLAALYVPQIKVPYAKAVEMFEALPASATLHDSILAEKQYMAPAIIKQLQDAEKHRPGGWRELWKQFLQGSEVPPELKEMQSLDEVTRLVNDFFTAYDEFAPIVTLPKAEFEAKYNQFKQQLTAENPLTALLLPTVDKLANKQYQLEARMAMLLAAIAVTEGGREKLEGIRDPFGDGPFKYRELDGGYELESKLVVDGKPVTLTIGSPKQ